MTKAVWVKAGFTLPCGARETDAMGPAAPGSTWLDLCLLGQHLPQCFPDTEIHELTKDECAALGLCPDCLGWGDAESYDRPMGAVALVRNADELHQACQTCGGTGRPAVRIAIDRSPGGITTQLTPQPHEFVNWKDMGPRWCAACGQELVEGAASCSLEVV